jgi:hypothetical protein
MTAPAGMVEVFAGWNVWAVLAKDDLDFEAMMVGLSPDRRLRIWVEEAADKVPGSAIADSANPMVLKGSQVEIIQAPEGLEPAQERASEMPGSTLNFDPKHTRKFVRFYNRGAAGVTPWPRNENFFLDTAYEPDASNPITGAPAPSSLGGAVTGAVEATGSTLKIVLGVALGVAVVGGLVWALSRSSQREDVAA